VAKKLSSKKNNILKFDVDFECIIKVNSEGKQSFARDLKRQELSLSVRFQIDQFSHGLQIYQGDISNGIIFDEIDAETYKVSAKGIIQKEYDSETRAQLQEKSSTPLIFSGICDHDVKDHYIDGDEDKKIKIGIYVE
jgi:hypothetical protein